MCLVLEDTAAVHDSVSRSSTAHLAAQVPPVLKPAHQWTDGNLELGEHVHVVDLSVYILKCTSYRNVCSKLHVVVPHSYK